MLEVKRGTRIYLPGDPSDQIYLLESSAQPANGDTHLAGAPRPH